eukprot:gene831-835_t
MDKTHTVSMRPEHVEMDRNLYIIKIGGNVIDNSDNLYHFLKDFTDLPGDKILVHGGGKVATQLCETLGIEAKLVEGRRITDIETLRVVTMVYGGLINKNIVAQLQYFGNNAIGLTGADGDFIRASKRPVKTIDYGYVGDINEHSIDPDRINRLLSAGFTPVFCALTHDGEGQLLNTNADTIASALAIALSNVGALTDFADQGYHTTDNNLKAVRKADFIVLAVLPQQLNKLLDEIRPSIKTEKQLIISVISGVSCGDIRKQLDLNVQIVRAMPNTAIAIGQSMTCIATDNGTPKNINFVRSLFDTVGTTIQINEELMTAASQGGTEIGFHAHDALKMAAQTAKGAADLLLQLSSHPEQEIDKVTSPSGCTIAGLNEMEHNGFSSAMIKGIKLSAEKAGDLYQG